MQVKYGTDTAARKAIDRCIDIMQNKQTISINVSKICFVILINKIFLIIGFLTLGQED